MNSPLPDLTGEAIDSLAGRWGGGGRDLWEDVRRLVARYDSATLDDRGDVWHHLVMAVGNFKRDGGRRLHPPRLTSPAPAAARSPMTLPDGQTVDADDDTTWGRVRIKGMGAPTKTTLFAALWPDRHFIYDRRVHRATNSIRILAGLDGTDDAEPTSIKGGDPTMDRYLLVRSWVLGCAAATGRPLTSVERALYELDQRIGVSPKTGRTWKVCSEIAEEKLAGLSR